MYHSGLNSKILNFPELVLVVGSTKWITDSLGKLRKETNSKLSCKVGPVKGHLQCQGDTISKKQPPMGNIL